MAGTPQYRKMVVGLDGQTITDRSLFARPVTAVGGVVLDTTTKILGASSIRIPNGGYLQAAVGSELRFHGDFTILGSLRVNAFTATYAGVLVSDLPSYTTGSNVLFVGGNSAPIVVSDGQTPPTAQVYIGGEVTVNGEFDEV